MTAQPLTIRNAPDAALADLAVSFEAQANRARSLGEAIRAQRNLDGIRAEQARRAREAARA